MRVNLALMEAENMRRATERAGRPALHPLAEYYGNWERERAARREEPRDEPFTLSLSGDDA